MIIYLLDSSFMIRLALVCRTRPPFSRLSCLNVLVPIFFELISWRSNLCSILGALWLSLTSEINQGWSKIKELFKSTRFPAFQLNDQMTCRMSASKQKKRQINCTNSEQYRPGKKTKFDSSNCLVSLKPHIGLKWDQYLRRVVPEKEQVGILWSDLAPFIEGHEHCSGLADVTYVPPGTFSLESLRGVLSYEVCLSFSYVDSNELPR